MSRDTTSDCYYYFNSSCAKGDDCSFRHCEAALGTETVCLFWKSGSCVRQDCKYRHTDVPIDRSRTLCYFESQPGGCQKPHCAFRHRRKGCSETDDHSSETNGDAAVGTSERKSAVTSDQTVSDSATNGCDIIPDPVPAIPVEPVSFRIVEEDESDVEDEKKHRLGKQTEAGDGIVVKSLEQIRMERIFKQDSGSPDTHKRPSGETNVDKGNSGKNAKRVRLIRPQITDQPDAAVRSERQKHLTESPADLNFTDLLEGDCDNSTAGDDSDILQEIDKIINS